MSVKKFTKKPVEIEAIQWTGDNLIEVGEFVGGCKVKTQAAIGDNKPNVSVLIETLEGTMAAGIGDYIIKGIKGEFYPCKPDIFIATYAASGQTNKLTFGQALEAVKRGEVIAREGWNGKGMSVTMARGIEAGYDALMSSDIKKAILIRNLAESNVDHVPSARIVNPFLVMIAADGSVVPGWLASQTDILAEDWCILQS